MKKYRVVKAYSWADLGWPYIRKVGDILTDLLYPDEVALQLGALEEVKAWEPKEDEVVWLVTLDQLFRVSFVKRSCYGRHFDDGLIYPTREQAEECLRRMLETAKKYKEEVLGT